MSGGQVCGKDYSFLATRTAAEPPPLPNIFYDGQLLEGLTGQVIRFNNGYTSLIVVGFRPVFFGIPSISQDTLLFNYTYYTKNLYNIFAPIPLAGKLSSYSLTADFLTSLGAHVKFFTEIVKLFF